MRVYVRSARAVKNDRDAECSAVFKSTSCTQSERQSIYKCVYRVNEERGKRVGEARKRGMQKSYRGPALSTLCGKLCKGAAAAVSLLAATSTLAAISFAADFWMRL